MVFCPTGGYTRGCYLQTNEPFGQQNRGFSAPLMRPRFAGRLGPLERHHGTFTDYSSRLASSEAVSTQHDSRVRPTTTAGPFA